MAKQVECIETGQKWDSVNECSYDMQIPFRYLSRLITEGRTHRLTELTFRYTEFYPATDTLPEIMKLWREL